MLARDWIGNSVTTFAVLGASSHSDGEREQNDFYATEPKAVRLLLEQERFYPNIWEPACGKGHISEALAEQGYIVKSTDLIDRGYGAGNADFLLTSEKWGGDIITNPPYKYAQEFVLKALEIIGEGHKVAMFLKIQFLEGKARRKLFAKHPPKTVYVSSSRLRCAMNGEFEKYGASAICYAWFVWEKGFTGEPTIRWIN